jgi:uncharacterized protein (TIGR02646 family)
MKLINKDIGNQPKSLVAYKQTLGASYEGYREKEDLRKTLLNEQGALCCYCMSRIKNDFNTTSIEHYIPQKQYPDKSLTIAEHESQALNYANLLLACNSDELNKCSEKKGNKKFAANPLDKRSIIQMGYRRDGRIFSTNKDIESDIKELELNKENSTLLKSRAEIIELELANFEKEMSRKKTGSPWTKQDYQRKIDSLNSKIGNQFKPFVQAVIYLLEQKQAKAPN